MLEGRGGSDKLGEESAHQAVDGLLGGEEMDPVDVRPAVSAMAESRRVWILLDT